MIIGLFRTSLKENERRVPLYPEHLPRYPEDLRRKMVFEAGYGSDYGFEDAYFEGLGARVVPRDRLFIEGDLIVLPKPMPEDVARMKPRQILFGWSHAVQQRAIAQLAIDRRLTVISWENMHHWSPGGEKLVHVFYKNNEIAGYAAVLHCLQLVGIDGHYGPTRRVIILSYGSVSRGAIYAFHGLGFKKLYVYTRRPPYLVADQNPDARHGRYFEAPDGTLMIRNSEEVEFPLIDTLAGADIIFNGILQDTNKPVMFVRDDEVQRLKPRSVIINCCDEACRSRAPRRSRTSLPGRNRPVLFGGPHTVLSLGAASARSRPALPGDRRRGRRPGEGADHRRAVHHRRRRPNPNASASEAKKTTPWTCLARRN
jgi:hypothetical protein